MQRDVREIVTQPSELPVLRTEIVSPLADAMRLVDRDESHARLLERLPKRLTAVADEAFRGEIQQPAPVVANARQHRVALVRQERAVQV